MTSEKKSLCIGVIVCFITLSQIFALTIEERTFREELEARAEMEVSYEKYQGGFGEDP